MIYLDNSSTTKPYREAVETAVKYMTDIFGNPSSLHGIGLDAEKAVREARGYTADLISADPSCITFTGGGTEADNMAILGTARRMKRQGKRIITTKTEHPAVLEPCAYLEKLGYDVIYLDVDSEGYIDMDQLKDSVNDETILISVMHVNNELGTVNDIRKAASLKKNALFHTDAVQSLGKEHIDVSEADIDLLSMSGHKIHGPKGTGALYIRKGVSVEPLVMGGGQERGMRSGTENVPGIAGFGCAARMAADIDRRSALMALARNHLLEGIKGIIPDVRINSPENGCPSVLNVSFLGTRGEVILHMLEDEGRYVSTGSACSSNKKGQSHVLKAAGLTQEEIEGAIRFSFSEFNTPDEMDIVLEKLESIVRRFRKLGKFR